MIVESIYEIEVTNKNSTNGFNGRLIYAIIPCSTTKSATFYYSSANFSEGRSVARALSRFIEDFLGVDPNFIVAIN